MSPAGVTATDTPPGEWTQSLVTWAHTGSQDPAIKQRSANALRMRFHFLKRVGANDQVQRRSGKPDPSLMDAL
jgi:hypothetical protein